MQESFPQLISKSALCASDNIPLIFSATYFFFFFLQWPKLDSITLACCSLGSSHHPLSYSPSTSRGDGLSSIAQRCVFHMNNPPTLKCTQLPPSASSTPTTTPMLECSLKARAPSRSSVSSGSMPGNLGWTDKKTG